jgi:serine kinase of HPr protein (carbohydrate metabolism regulator)
MPTTPTVHASAVLVGARAALIRGPSGAGKSRLALALIAAAEAGHLRFARLVADDRSRIEPHHGRLLVRPAPALAGLIEVRGLGIRRLPFEPVGMVGLVVDLAAADADRLPAEASRRVTIEGIDVARLAVAPGIEALPLVLAALASDPPPELVRGPIPPVGKKN